MAKILKPKKKVVVAMSGGVDSSVAAALLKNQGYDVLGVFMQFWFPSGEKYGENRCCSLASWHEAKKVAEIIGIPIYRMNFGREFKRAIVDEFLRSYRGGQTPNPCVACNKFIKFDLLWQKARAVFDADFLSTGHYVSLLSFPRRRESGIKKNGSPVTFKLFRAKDTTKDQTYFLYNLKQNDLAHLLFPLGGYQKTAVRKMALDFGLPVYDKKDSQEICFVGKSHIDFLKSYLKLKPGKIVDERGVVIGAHAGLPLYTIGQREGLGLSGGPWYVCGFNLQKNQLIITKDQKHSAIYQKSLICREVNWLGQKPKMPLKCQAVIRYHAKPANCEVKTVKGGLRVDFKQKQRAIMPGQSVVFYNGQELLGGGIIWQ